MNTLKKVGLTALGTSLIATSAFAGDVTVTGSAGITLENVDNTDAGNSFSMTDQVVFAGSGELDNGMTVSLSLQLDGNIMDDRSVTIATPDMGTLVFSGHGGSSAMSAVDDVTPSAYEESWGVIGSTAETTAGRDSMENAIGGGTTDNSFFYTAPEMVEGLGVKASYTPSGTGRPDGTVSWNLEYTGIDGLTLGYAQDDNGLSGTSQIEYETAYVKYAFGSFTIGMQDGSQDQQGATTSDDEYSAIGISYQVSDDLSVSYNSSERDFGDGDADQEAEAMQLSYTTGGVTVSAALAEVKNVGGSTNAQDDIEGFEIDVSFAF
jgi:outer membrane protein OmpU